MSGLEFMRASGRESAKLTSTETLSSNAFFAPRGAVEANRCRFPQVPAPDGRQDRTFLLER